ncbi:hypothetical protein JR316_0003335 [Psilocybe cubensis]|uniref:Uncharacterized protein n=2 Tax=Psilocybe cubensis TaxID=181762 RepID=A0A8H7Y283_PSICU|nr:hypothetical protein JR316_0003335 [Psilocybe cubensis]KAH9483857.1 hypothetical protein JR316_0003335 [Psilocybe cubensis]
MRFFKSFNLLHRRTKSATFVPGLSAPSLDFPATTNIRSSSFTIGDCHRSTAPLSLFDLVTSNPPPIPVNFNHLYDTPSDRVLGIWRSRRNSDKSSLANIQSSVNKELARLSEAVNFWISEYGKLQILLRDCHEELVAERLKSAKLERIIEELRHEKASFGVSLDLSADQSGDTSFTRFSGDTSTLQSQKSQVLLYPRTGLPSTSSASGSDSLGESKKPRTLDEYSSALRMTLAARKELRDQKKISKFWKRLAVAIEEHQDTITPSVSTISSIREVIPADRQAAVQALMSRRALSAKLAVENTSRTIDSAGLKLLTDRQTPTGAAYTLDTSASKESVFSRLEPLASESMKQEISVLFGSGSVSRSLASSSSRRNSSLEASGSISYTAGLSRHASHSLSIESFQDISMIFQRAFGVDTSSSKCESAGQSTKASDSASADIRLPVSMSNKKLIASASSTCLPIPPLVSTNSQVWVNVDSTNIKTNTRPLGDSRRKNDAPPHSIKTASKECTSRRSWHRYMAKSSPQKRRSVEDQPPSSRETGALQAAEGKENSGFSMSIPAFKRSSRLPVPSRALNERNPCV